VSDNSRSVPAPHRPSQFAPGDRVYIARGELSGLKGIIVALKDPHKCVLRIDATARGMYVVISDIALARFEVGTGV
jgi:hypothetical protein